MKDIIKTEKNMEPVNFSGVIIVIMRVSLRIITFMDKVHINGLMAECMSDSGNLTKCTERVYLLGQTEDNTKGKTFKNFNFKSLKFTNE